MLLYEDGDLDRAARYIQTNMMDVLDGHFNTRMSNSGKAQLMIAAASLRAEHRRRMLWLGLSSVITALLLVSVAFFLRYRSLSKRLDHLNADLTDANIIKENYVFRYMALSVNYLERQDEFRHSLLQTVKEDGLPAVRQRLSSPTESYQAFKEFYRIFDETILLQSCLCVDASLEEDIRITALLRATEQAEPAEPVVKPDTEAGKQNAEPSRRREWTRL